MASPTPRPLFESHSTGKLSDKVARFNAHVAKHEKKQLENPFSEWDGASTKPKLSIKDENYGHPEVGSKSYARAVKAKQNMEREIDMLLNVITLMSPDTGVVVFKELFQTYAAISDKLVGVMIHARRSGYIAFEGETLFQGRDDKELVHLTPEGKARHRESISALLQGPRLLMVTKKK